MKQQTFKTIADLIRVSGGPVALAKRTKNTEDEISSEGVRKWRARGIPDRHWWLFKRVTTPNELYRLNERARRKR